MCTIKAIPIILTSVLMAAPLAPQSPLVGSSCFLLYVGERSSPLSEGLEELLRSDELVEMRISFRSIQPASDDYAMYADKLNLAKDSVWALAATDSSGGMRRLLQGDKQPDATDILNAFDKLGVKSPINILRDFIKQHPDHLDARMQLLYFLGEIAETRTQRAIQLNNIAPSQFTHHMFSVPGSHHDYRFYDSIAIDTAVLDNKKLSPEQDIKIWGPYAQVLLTLFTSGDWRIVDLIRMRQTPVDACSPMMVQLYRRFINKIETSIEEYPVSGQLWSLYGWIVSITKHTSVRALVDRLAPLPYWDAWPDENILSLLIPEEEAKGNWGYIAETLWQRWHRTRWQAGNFNELSSYLAPPEAEMVNSAHKEAIWRYDIRPLLESLIRTNRIGDAETVILEYAKFTAFGDFQSRAADIALDCGRRDLHTKWITLRIHEEPAVTNYLDFLTKATTPHIITLNQAEPYNRQIRSILNQGRIIDWQLYHHNLNQAQSELLQQREGWSDTDTHWALFYNNKILAYGIGFPNEEMLYQTLERFNIETKANTLRRFISEHPGHKTAKEELMRELKRLAEQKTREKLGDGAGVDITLMLSEEDDYAIWAEYGFLYRQMLPDLMEQGGQLWLWLNNPFDSAFFINSRIIKNLSHSFLPKVEASLKRQPSDYFLWDTWIALSVLNEYRYFRNMREALVLSPLNDPLEELPPHFSRALLMGRYRARANWQEIIDVQEWRWNIMLENPDPRLNQYTWLKDIQYLLEAYLRLEKNAEANELVRIYRQSPAWEQIKQSAIDLAEKCGKPDLAEQWKK